MWNKIIIGIIGICIIIYLLFALVKLQNMVKIYETNASQYSAVLEFVETNPKKGWSIVRYFYKQNTVLLIVRMDSDFDYSVCHGMKVVVTFEKED